MINVDQLNIGSGTLPEKISKKEKISIIIINEKPT